MGVAQKPSDAADAALIGSGGGPGGRLRHEVLAVVFQVRNARLHVLLWQRAQAPFAHTWSLPGGPLEASERLGTSLSRHLATKVDLTNVAYLEQLETRSDVDRDPRERVIATAYMVLVSTDRNPEVPSDTQWHCVDDMPPTAFDHASIVESGRERLRAKLTYTNAGFAMAPETFTVTQLKSIYAACIGHPISATNLQRVLIRRKIIEPTTSTAQPTPAGGRPATLYHFTERVLLVTNPFAVFKAPATGSANS